MAINVKFNNMLETRITDIGGISASAQVFNITPGDGAKIPDLSGDGYIYAYFKDVAGNWELIKISSVTGDQCTIASLSDRGLGGSSARTWSQNDVVAFAPCAEELEDLVSELEVKLAMPSGTVMIFGQSSPPTGWTRKTNWQDNAMLCIASSGNIASGGSVNPQSAHSHIGPSHTHSVNDHTHTTGNFTLTSTHLPSHDHNFFGTYASPPGSSFGVVFTASGSGSAGASTNTTGSGSAHNHGTTGASGAGTTGAGGTGSTGNNTAPYYQEVIAATKD